MGSTPVHIPKKSKVSQSAVHEANLNSILNRYVQTGSFGNINRKPAVYGDFTSLGDYRQCLEVVADATKKFMALPSRLRDRFRNDPAEIIAWLGNPANKAEAEELGLLQPKVTPPQAETPPAEGGTQNPA